MDIWYRDSHGYLLNIDVRKGWVVARVSVLDVLGGRHLALVTEYHRQYPAREPIPRHSGVAEAVVKERRLRLS